MKKYFKFLTILFVSIVSIFMITGCEKENSLTNETETTDIQTKIENRITELVEGATDDKKLQDEMREELRFLIDENIAQWDAITIYYSSSNNDFMYQFNGDEAATRKWISDYMKSLIEDPSLSIRSHRRHTYLVTPKTYTVYVHADLSSQWMTAVSQAIAEWNALGLTVKLATGGWTYSKTNANAITVISENIGQSYSNGDLPTIGGIPGVNIRIHTNNPSTSASQKKFLMAHELGHTIGFRHTDTGDGIALTSSSYSCIPFSCDGTDTYSVMRQGGSAPPSWPGFTYCDQQVFQCVYWSLLV